MQMVAEVKVEKLVTITEYGRQIIVWDASAYQAEKRFCQKGEGVPFGYVKKFYLRKDCSSK